MPASIRSRRRQRHRPIPLAGLALATAALTIGSSGCTSPGRAGASSTAGGTALQIAHVLRTQADAWNKGDIETFMTAYWRSPELTFVSGGSVTRGWEPTLAGYRQRYPTRAAMGRLTFDDIEVRELARDAALVLGSWHLDRDPPEQPVGGRFTLLFRRMDGKWVIVYDHTSKE